MRFINHTKRRKIHSLLYDNSALAKYYSTKLWTDIVTKMKLSNKIFLDDLHGINRFVLYSAHDIQIFNLMATLGENVTREILSWPSFASMFVIEVHAILKKHSARSFVSGRAFRVLYNGKVVTPYIDGCPHSDDLCDLQVLLEIILPSLSFTCNIRETD